MFSVLDIQAKFVTAPISISIAVDLPTSSLNTLSQGMVMQVTLPVSLQ